MGTVHAKSAAGSNSTSVSHFNNDTDIMDYVESRKPQQPNERQQIKLDSIRARVDRIHVDGLSRTKDDIIKYCVDELFHASDFEDVITKAHEVREKLNSIGCFKDIGIYIDVSSGPGATPEGLEVTFNVKELSRVVGGVNTMVSENEGNVVLGMKLPNIFGRGEKAQAEYSLGYRKNSNFSVSLSKPFPWRLFSPILSASVFQQTHQFPWSGYKLLDRGLLFDVAFNSSSVTKHNLQWEGLIRDTSVLSKTASFKVRECSGPQLKSALRHVLSVDHRDDPIFPSEGGFVQMTNEVSGLGGGVAFLKNELYLQGNFTILPDIVLQVTGQLGVLHDWFGTDVTEHLYLGGPTNLRGFHQRGVGPHHENCSIGGKVYWASGIHLFTPLPFRPGQNGLGELFRSHFFINTGNIDLSSETIDLMNTRVSGGGGIAVRLGRAARLEFNYVMPLRAMPEDKTAPGLQFGIGVKFL